MCASACACAPPAGCARAEKGGRAGRAAARCVQAGVARCLSQYLQVIEKYHAMLSKTHETFKVFQSLTAELRQTFIEERKQIQSSL